MRAGTSPRSASPAGSFRDVDVRLYRLAATRTHEDPTLPPRNLSFKAGKEAFDSIRGHGFAVEDIGTIAGASGGAKWLVLSQLDRVIATSVLPRLNGPVHLLGSSIGAWRLACYAQRDPHAAIERFEEAYIVQSYSESPDIVEITAKSREILGEVLGAEGTAEILANPVLRLNVMTVRARHVAASERPVLLGTALLAAAAANAVSRKTLGLFFERALFFDARERPPFLGAPGFGLQSVPLGRDNLEDAVIASGSIPMVLSGVRDIAGAMPGVYRDGGVIDYHLDVPQSAAGRLCLYPHFYPKIVPGWFDKRLRWRRPRPEHVARTLLISPTEDFVSLLPGGKIPDRSDFRTYSPNERIAVWRRVAAESRALADELADVLDRGLLPERLELL